MGVYTPYFVTYIFLFLTSLWLLVDESMSFQLLLGWLGHCQVSRRWSTVESGCISTSKYGHWSACLWTRRDRHDGQGKYAIFIDAGWKWSTLAQAWTPDSRKIRKIGWTIYRISRHGTRMDDAERFDGFQHQMSSRKGTVVDSTVSQKASALTFIYRVIVVRMHVQWGSGWKKCGAEASIVVAR